MTPLSRRDFVRASSSCAANLALFAAVAPRWLRDTWARRPLGPVIAHEPFGNLERVADGIWALISTPLTGDQTTLANGGIIAGKHAVLAIEGFYKPDGARWLAGKAKELTGRWPTHVVVTHYHADHSDGVAGYLDAEHHPEIRTTTITRDETIERNKPADVDRTAALRGEVSLSLTDETTLDLGGRTVHIIPHKGHTDSDVSLELDEPSLIFCGDLFWNAMFPNYVDALPIELSQSVRALRRKRETIYVPGHGAVGTPKDFDTYIAMIDEVERAARAAHVKGVSADDAAAKFTLPASLGEWYLFGKSFYPRAFAAWYRELDRA